MSGTTYTLDANIGFIGAGSMSGAIIRGLAELRIADPKRIFAINKTNAARLDELAGKFGIRTPRTEEERSRFIREADMIVLGMKPKDAANAIASFRHLLRPGQLIVSVIAGLSIATIRQLIGADLPIVRTMPNIASTVGMGATGLSFSPEVSEAQREEAVKLFRSIGHVNVVEERLLDIVTGVSGSGPAYVYYLMEAMIAAGVAEGLSEQAARELTVETVLGAAHLAKMTDEKPDELRRKVTSPNGTTQAAIEWMEARGVSEAVSGAVRRAAERSRELGEAIAKDALSQGKEVQP